MAVLISLSLSDMLVVGLVYGRLIPTRFAGLTYFQFLVPGIVVVGLFSAATDTGRRIWLALREGVVQYYLTLPIRTGGLVGAYIISGGLGGIVYSGSRSWDRQQYPFREYCTLSYSFPSYSSSRRGSRVWQPSSRASPEEGRCTGSTRKHSKCQWLQSAPYSTLRKR